MKIASFYFLILVYIFSCNPTSNKIDKNQKDKHQLQTSQDSSIANEINITFRGFDSSALGAAWFYYDEYNQQRKVNLGETNTSINWSNENLLLYYTIPQTGYYPVSPGDSIVIIKDTSFPYYPKLDIRSNTISAFELNFPSFLSNRNSNIFEYSVRKMIPNKMFSLNGDAKQYYDRAVLLTDSCVKAGFIHDKYEQWIKKALRYDFYSEALWAKEIPDSVVLNVLLKDQPNMHNALYKKLLIDYFSIVDLKRKNDYKNGYNIAKQKYSGEIRDFLLMISLLQILKGTQKDREKYISMFNADCQNNSYKGYIKQNFSELPSNKSSQKDIIVNDYKKAFLLDSLLANSKDSLIYVDIWASWCAPCRAEMPHSKALRKQYNGNKIKFIFLSIDDNYGNWIKANSDEQLNENSYFLINSTEAFFTKKNKITTIPRYILLDKRGSIINADAPRPSDPKLEELINKNL